MTTTYVRGRAKGKTRRALEELLSARRRKVQPELYGLLTVVLSDLISQFTQTMTFLCHAHDLIAA
jgi:hypothetical protein